MSVSRSQRRRGEVGHVVYTRDSTLPLLDNQRAAGRSPESAFIRAAEVLVHKNRDISGLVHSCEPEQR